MYLCAGLPWHGTRSDFNLPWSQNCPMTQHLSSLGCNIGGVFIIWNHETVWQRHTKILSTKFNNIPPLPSRTGWWLMTPQKFSKYQSAPIHAYHLPVYIRLLLSDRQCVSVILMRSGPTPQTIVTLSSLPTPVLVAAWEKHLIFFLRFLIKHESKYSLLSFFQFSFYVIGPLHWLMLGGPTDRTLGTSWSWHICTYVVLCICRVKKKRKAACPCQFCFVFFSLIQLVN